VILVTGASGNVGGEVIRAVLAVGYQVRGLSRQSSPGVPAGAEVVLGDLNDRGSLRSAFAGVDAVFLLAGYPEVSGLLAEMRTAGVGRVVLLSSGAVAGGPRGRGGGGRPAGRSAGIRQDLRAGGGAFSASTRDVRQAKPLPSDRDQPRRILPPLLGST
jgi:uncharacterized protein YbjT (DUF2867 family)